MAQRCVSLLLYTLYAPSPTGINRESELFLSLSPFCVFVRLYALPLSRPQAVVGVLPKLVPAVTACLHGSTSSNGASSVPPDLAVAAGALGVLEALVSLLRSTMRPHVKKVEGATALWLQVRNAKAIGDGTAVYRPRKRA